MNAIDSCVTGHNFHYLSLNCLSMIYCECILAMIYYECLFVNINPSRSSIFKYLVCFLGAGLYSALFCLSKVIQTPLAA